MGKHIKIYGKLFTCVIETLMKGLQTLKKKLALHTSIKLKVKKIIVGLKH